MADRLGDQGIAVCVGISLRAGLRLRVCCPGDGTKSAGDCLELGPETPDGAVLRYPASLPAAQRALALAAALEVLRPARPWPQAPCTLRTPDGPRQGQRHWGRLLVEFPAPLFRRLHADEILAAGLAPGFLAAHPGPCRITLDGAMLAAVCRDRESLSVWRAPKDLGSRLNSLGLDGLVLCVWDRRGPLVRSWLDTGQEVPSPLAAGVAACLWHDAGHVTTRVPVIWPASRESAEVRPRLGPSGIHRLDVVLRAGRV